MQPAEALAPVLLALAESARPLLGQPLRASADNLAGFIETVSVDEHGHIWIIGWLKRSLGHEFSVVIVDRKRHAGAVSVLCHDRADLPPDAQAMIGLIHSDWRPGTAAGELFALVAPELKLFLRGINPLRVADADEITQHFLHVQGSATAGRGAALRGLLLGANDWVPNSALLNGFSVQAAVDQVLAVPGFGCFIAGWVVSPSKPVVQFSLRLGDRVLHGVPGSLACHPRPDLTHVGGQTARLLDRAGFSLVMEGDFSAKDLANPILKARFADGSSANFAINPEVLCRLGHAVPLDEVLQLHPGLAEEPCFPRLAAALRRNLVGRLTEVTSITAGDPQPRCVVLAVPPHASDARLLVEALIQALPRPPWPLAVVLLADAGTNRGHLPLLARMITEASGQRCGISLVEQVGKPLWALPTLLAAAGCDRFLLLAMNSFPDRLGWAAALAALADDTPAPQALRHRDPGGLAALAWTRLGLTTWLAGNQPALGQRHFDTLLRLAAPLPGQVLTVSAGPPGERLLDAVDLLARGAAA